MVEVGLDVIREDITTAMRCHQNAE